MITIAREYEYRLTFLVGKVVFAFQPSAVGNRGYDPGLGGAG